MENIVTALAIIGAILTVTLNTTKINKTIKEYYDENLKIMKEMNEKYSSIEHKVDQVLVYQENIERYYSAKESEKIIKTQKEVNEKFYDFVKKLFLDIPPNDKSEMSARKAFDKAKQLHTLHQSSKWDSCGINDIQQRTIRKALEKTYEYMYEEHFQNFFEEWIGLEVSKRLEFIKSKCKFYKNEFNFKWLSYFNLIVEAKKIL